MAKTFQGRLEDMKKYFNRLRDVFVANRLQLFLLFLFLLAFLIYRPESKVVWALAVLFVALLLVQYLLLFKRNYFFYVLRAAVAVVLLFEMILPAKVRWPNLNESVIGDELTTVDDSLVWKAAPGVNSRVASFDVTTRDTAYSVLYSIDSMGRRDSARAVTVSRPLSLNMFGCSYTFGEGLPFNATIGYQFEQEDSSWKVNNYGFRGYGPNQMLIQILNMPKADGEYAADGLYTYIPDHLNRVWGGTEYLSWGGSSPDVYVVNNEVVVKKRSLIWQKANSFIYKSRIASYAKLRFEYPTHEKFLKRFAAIINKAAEIHCQKNPGKRFFVGLYPRLMKDEEEIFRKTGGWMKYLAPSISIIDAGSLDLEYDTTMRWTEYVIPLDGHPNGKLNKVYVDTLVRYLKAR
jgi:hypothetical protein